MKKIIDADYSVPEWEWLKTQLRFSAMERKTRSFGIRYEFVDEEPLINCSFHFLDQYAPSSGLNRDSFLETIKNFIQLEVIKLQEEIAKLPVIRGWFDLNTDIAFHFLHDYGQGSVPICTVKGDDVSWGAGY